ncbi:hypothetical protein F5141DRAFT_1134486 [Pisolithus sp. B1]|nr:hypothetical protein F5141DRAFT_1134486 [Pisolithus sp. B1]
MDYMSTPRPDIPLHIIAPVSSSNRDHHQNTNPESTERRMHSNVLKAASKNLTKGRNKGKGNTTEQYLNESDEATLSGNVQRHGEDVEESTQMKRSQVSHLATLSKSRIRQDKSRTIPSHPGGRLQSP